MLDIEKNYNLQIDQLRKLIKPLKTFDAAIELALAIHAITHTRGVSSSDAPTFCDELLSGLQHKDFSSMPTEKCKTIAWHLWHIARIEDLVGNVLIMEQPQVFNDQWMARLNVTIKDTGNAMENEQMIDFSNGINTAELINYRNDVGCQTRKILKSLTPKDLKRKPSPESLARLVSEDGLLESKNSIWLKDFWGRHTVAGLILLPITRHHMMHLLEVMHISKAIQIKQQMQ